MATPIPRLFVFYATVLVSGYGQELGTLAFDTSNMKVTVTMDRETYLPGEAAEITLRVSNPASTPVKSLSPFLSSTSCLYSMKRDQPLRIGGPPPSNCGSVPDSSNTTTFVAGELKQVVLNSYENLFDIDLAAMTGRSVPTTPGTYSLMFQYGATASAQVEYAVSDAKVEADTIARLRDIVFTRHPAKVAPEVLPMYVHVLALRSGEQSYICVQQITVTNTSLVARREFFGDDLDVTDPRVQMTAAIPFKRVATSSTSIVTLSTRAHDNEDLMIEWTDSAGRKDRLNYPASYPARSPAQHQ